MARMARLIRASLAVLQAVILARGDFDVVSELPNNAMQLTRLSAAPVPQAEVPHCAPAGETDGGAASQLIRGGVRTMTRKRSRC